MRVFFLLVVSVAVAVAVTAALDASELDVLQNTDLENEDMITPNAVFNAIFFDDSDDDDDDDDVDDDSTTSDQVDDDDNDSTTSHQVDAEASRKDASRSSQTTTTTTQELNEVEQLEHPKYSVPGTLNLQSAKVVPLDDGPQRARNTDAGVVKAAKYVMERVNEAKVRCKKGVFTSVEVTHAMDEPGEGTQYMLEVLMRGGKGVAEETYHVSVGHLLKFKDSVGANAATGKEETLDYRIRVIMPMPCAYIQLAQTFLDVKQHNANPERQYDMAVHDRFFGKTVEHVQMSFGSKEPRAEDVDPALLVQWNKGRRRATSTTTMEPTRPPALNSSNLPASYEFKSQATNSDLTSDQGTCASCYAYAAGTVVAARIYHAQPAGANINVGDVRLSIDEIQDCTDQCNGGNAMTVFERLKTQPVSEEWCLPDRATLVARPGRARRSVVPGGGFCGSACVGSNATSPFSAKWGVQRYYMLITSGLPAAGRVKAIQKELIDNGPLYAGIDITHEFMAYSGGVFAQKDISAKSLGGHAMALIGWNSSAVVPYWILQNSWSPFWGENGRVYMKMGTNELNLETKSLWAPVVAPRPANSVAQCPGVGQCLMDSTCKCRKTEVSTCGDPSRSGRRRDSKGGCSLVFAAPSYSEGSPEFSKLDILWNTPSDIGSYCQTQLDEYYPKAGPGVTTYVPETNKTFSDPFYFCGPPQSWSTNKSKCPTVGNVTIPDSYLLSTLGPNREYQCRRLKLKCYRYLGLNEFGLSRGFKQTYSFEIGIISGAKQRAEKTLTNDLKDLPPAAIPDPVPAANKYFTDKQGDLFYVGTDGNLYSVGKDGNRVAVSLDGNRLTVDKDGNLFAVSKDGNRIAVGKDGNLFTVSLEGNRIAIDKDGNRLVVGTDGNRFAVGKDGNLVAIGKDGNLFSMGKDGNLFSVSADGNMVAVVKDGNRVSISKDGNLFATGKDGKQSSVAQDGNLFTRAKDAKALSGGDD